MTASLSALIAMGLSERQHLNAMSAAARKVYIKEVYCEGRTLTAWCGEFVSWLFARQGVKDATVINRVEVAGKWRSGWDIAIWDQWAIDHKVKRSAVTGPGLYVIPAASGDHIGIVRGVNADGTYNTLDGNSFEPIGLNKRSPSVGLRFFIAETDLQRLFDAANGGITIWPAPPAPPGGDVTRPPPPEVHEPTGLKLRANCNSCSSGAGKDKPQ